MKLTFLDRGDRMWCVHDARSDAHLAAMACEKGNNWILKYGDGDDRHDFKAVNAEAAKAYVTKWLEALEAERTKVEGKFPHREFKAYSHQQLSIVGAVAVMFDREAAFTEALLEQIALNVAQLDEPQQAAVMAQIVKDMYAHLKEANDARAERAKQVQSLQGLQGALVGMLMGRVGPRDDSDDIPAAPKEEKTTTKLH